MLALSISKASLVLIRCTNLVGCSSFFKLRFFNSTEEVSDLQEKTTKIATRLLAEKRKEGASDMKELFGLTKNIKPQSEESKQALGDEVSDAVEDTVPKSVRRRSEVDESSSDGEESRKRRRRALEDDNVNNDGTGMSVSEVGQMDLH